MLNNEVLLPFRCHEWLKSLKSPVMTGLFRPVVSLPLDEMFLVSWICSGCWYISIRDVVLLYQLFSFTRLLLVKSWSRIWGDTEQFMRYNTPVICSNLCFNINPVYFTTKLKYVKADNARTFKTRVRAFFVW